MLRAAAWGAASMVAGIVIFFVLVWLGSVGYALLVLWGLAAARDSWVHGKPTPSSGWKLLRAALVAIVCVALAFIGAEAFVASVAPD